MRVFVARQPIFDLQQKVVAYELLFRDGTDNAFPEAMDGDGASAALIHDTLQTIGFDQLTNGKLAFINVTRSLLVREIFTFLPPAQTVVEVLETVEPDAEVIAACASARRAGYTLALDDFVYHERFRPLLELAHIVKVDFLAVRGAARKELVDRLAPFRVALLAEKVETHEDVREAKDLGFQYLQGYFFCRPEIVSGHAIPQSKLSGLQLLKALQEPIHDVDRLVAIVKRDPGMSVKLLQYLNSSYFRFGKEVSSLRHATVLLGEQGFRKWASLLTLKALGKDAPDELVRTSLVRARFCEQLAAYLRLELRGIDPFLLGMLSAIDAILGRPLTEVLATLSLAPEFSATLLRMIDPPEPSLDVADSESPACRVLGLALAYERADWASIERRCAQIGVSPRDVQPIFDSAIPWANRTVDSGGNAA